MTTKLAMIEKRADISKLIVHLTRDSSKTFPNGGSAEENFLKILEEREIKARRPHSLYAAKVPLLYKKKFHVTCFTETPITQISRLARHIVGRQIQLEPWGFAFDRELMFERGAHQVAYVNSYPANDPVREGYDELFQDAVASKFAGKKWNMLPFVSAIQQAYDFGWEREVRIRGSFSFGYDELVCAIVPENVGVSIRKTLADLAIPFFTPGWSVERFIIESRKQLQRVRRQALGLPPKRKPRLHSN